MDRKKRWYRCQIKIQQVCSRSGKDIACRSGRDWPILFGAKSMQKHCLGETTWFPHPPSLGRVHRCAGNAWLLGKTVLGLYGGANSDEWKKLVPILNQIGADVQPLRQRYSMSLWPRLAHTFWRKKYAKTFFGETTWFPHPPSLGRGHRCTGNAWIIRRTDLGLIWGTSGEERKRLISVFGVQRVETEK